MTEKNCKTSKLVCPECGGVIEYTGDSDYNVGGELYYIGECKTCDLEFRIYKEKKGYELWYEVED